MLPESRYRSFEGTLCLLGHSTALLIKHNGGVILLRENQLPQNWYSLYSGLELARVKRAKSIRK
jgi:hypothetical protein